MRWLFLVHRYLGIVLGLLMLMWCLSGVVMMYVPYPELSESARAAALETIDWGERCTIDARALSDTEQVTSFEIEMLAGRPVILVKTVGSRSRRLIDLRTGAAVGTLSQQQAQTTASLWGRAGGHWDQPEFGGLIDYDQWTVAGGFTADRPLYLFRIDDAAETQLYVSSMTGKVVQTTTAHERFWNWLGAVPHWLYFARLRHEPALWSALVIYTSLIGCFLAMTGIYLGWRQFGRRPAGRWTGYRGVRLWHHLPGLIFGAFTLSWITSGFLSMNPWGLLEGSDARLEQGLLRGPPLSGAQVKQIVGALSVGLGVPDIVSIRLAPLFGHPYVVLTSQRDERSRVDPMSGAVPLTPADVDLEAHTLADGKPFTGPELLATEDRYYFSHHLDEASLPVFRLVLQAGTRYYLDPVSGALVRKIDRGAQGYRWLHQALHRLDFSGALRARPTWDVLMLVLLAGVTLVCATGAYMGLNRLVGRERRHSSLEVDPSEEPE